MAHDPVQIDPDITRAATLPSWCYRDAGFHDHLRERVFAPSWQLIGDRALVDAPQRVHPFVLLEGCLDEPLLLARDAGGRLRCLSNVCTHRGHLVATEPGSASTLRCRYHGRRFQLDGTFHSMPEFEGAEGFPCPSDDLTVVPHAQWHRFLFASLAPALPLEDLLAPVTARTAFLPWDDAVLDPQRSKDYLVEANWMLYCDNFLEGFHIPFVHPALADVLDHGSYRTECTEHGNVQIGIARGADATFALPAGHPDHGLQVAGWYFWCFPNLMINVYPWGTSINLVRPLAVDRTLVSYLTWVWDAAKLDEGAGAALDVVEREDEEVVERVQIGIRSRHYDRGRYSPAREQCVHHFHRMIAAAAGGRHLTHRSTAG